MDFWQRLLEMAAEQGPYALVLAGLAFAFARYWILPKAAADLEKTKSDAESNKQQAEALKTVAKAYDQLIVENHSYRNDWRKIIAIVTEVTEAMIAGDHARARSLLTVLKNLNE